MGVKLRQNKVTAKAIALLRKKCKEVVEGQNLTLEACLHLKAGEIKGIQISGRTLRKIFSGERVHVNSITNTMNDVGLEYIIVNGKIDIEDEENENDNSETI